MKGGGDGATYAAFGGAVVIGGANFVAVTYSNMELPPLFGAAARFALAAVLFFLLAWLRGVPHARGREAAGAAGYGVLGFGAAYALIYYALIGLPAATVAVIMATVPLFTFIMAVLLRQERPSARGLLGSLLALAGIAVLSGVGTGPGTGAGAAVGSAISSYFLAGILSAVAVAGSTIVARRFRDVHPLSMNAIGMTAGTVLLVLGSALLDERWIVPREGGTLLALAWLVLLGSVGLFQLFLYVVRRWSASATVYAIAAMPVVAAALGAILLDQPVTLQVLMGGGLVMLAVYVGAIRRPRVADGAAPAAASASPGAASSG